MIVYVKITTEDGVPVSNSNPLPVAIQGGSGSTEDRPSTPNVGQFYFDTDLGIPIWYDGENWVDSSGTTV